MMNQFNFQDRSAMTAKDAVAVVFKHKGAIALVYFAFVLAVGTYCFFWPPTYEAAVRLLVKNDRQEPVISPEQDGVRMISRQAVTEEDLNSEMAIVTSSAVLEQTARDMKLDTLPEHWLVRLLNAPVESLSEAYNNYHGKQNLDAFGRAVRRLAQKVSVEPEKKSAILRLKVRWGDPQFAEALLERVRVNYVAKHLAVHASPDTQDFFRDQIHEKREHLAQTERKIEAVRPGATTGTLSLEKELDLKQAADFESEARKARALYAEAQAKVDAGQQQLKLLPDRVVTEVKTLSNPLALGNLKTRVLELELKHTELMQKYKPDQPLVMQAGEQLAQAQRMLDRELAGSATEQSTNANPVGQSIAQDVTINNTRLQGLQALGAAMSKEYGDYRERLNQIARQAMELHQLERERTSDQQSLAAYEKQYEDARTNDQMNRLRLVNVAAIEEVRAGADPVKPNRWLLMKLALSLGLLLAMGFAFLLELLDQRVRSERDIELDLGVPVLATLGYYKREASV